MYQFRGDVDMITKLKTLLDLKDVGWMRKYSRKEKEWARSPAWKILIEGAPGVGKTTLGIRVRSGKRESCFSSGQSSCCFNFVTQESVKHKHWAIFSTIPSLR